MKKDDPVNQIYTLAELKRIGLNAKIRAVEQTAPMQAGADPFRWHAEHTYDKRCPLCQAEHTPRLRVEKNRRDHET